VHKQSYLSGFLGDKRPINAVEIGHVYSAIEANLIGDIISLAFAQVVKDERIKKQCMRGSEISQKHIEKFIAFHMSTLSAFGLGRYGLSASQCTRKDIPLTFIQAGVEVTQYAKDWLDIMLDNGWLERIPEAADRKELIGI